MRTIPSICRILVLTSVFAGFGATALLAKPMTADEKAKRKKEVVATLSGTTWEVELFSMDDPKKKPIKDTVSYEHGRLKSKHFATEGYPDSNLTVTIEDDGKAIWETMQSNPDMGPVFWRGELSDKTVTGVVSRTDKAGKTEAFSIRGLQTGTFEVAPEAAPVIIEAPKEVEAPTPPPAPVDVAAVEQAAKPFDALFGKPKTSETLPEDFGKKAAAPAVKPAASAPMKKAVAEAAPMKKVEPAAAKTAVAVKTEAKAMVKTPAAATVQKETTSAAKTVKKDAEKEKWFW